ncbi:MAG: hypothetical protein EOP11_03075 [Proteobacteria bacterium]|nr:MAG: hypothetical protein EOP11_03075 [Pseudomonadota bacterium]
MLKATLRVITFLFLLGTPTVSEAAESCLAPYPVSDRLEWWDFSMITRSEFPLLSRNSRGVFETYATAHLEWNNRLNLAFDYQMPGDMGGLEYSLYRLEIQVGRDGDPDKFTYVQDFTNGCTEAGRSIFPGQSIRLNAVKVPPRLFGLPRGREVVRIKIWGHL